MPNKLFFEEKENAKCLVDLLKMYQFTAEENTPLETEVALDPELLGKIFENLLASVDQNTAQMARKATGSFYTPREIVDYMVVESLLAYLNGHLEKAKAQKLEHLKDLDKKDEATKKVLLEALDKLKILDPACGSGAFPMGILHQIQDILRQIDKDNTHWKESLIQSFPVYLQGEMRKKLQGENLDYVRKLGIISKSIYGVDIQPIAIQITKLRCFLSLVIDQNTNELPEDNFGIKPLPNLEFKFVGANTLIGLGLREFYDKEGKLFANKFEETIKALQAITDKYFQTDQNGNSKATLQKDFDKLQRELLQIVGDLTKQSPKAAEIAQKLLQWQPFEDTATTPFFDSYYMFGVKEGFDIVLGNPPYVQLQKMKAQQADFEKQGYKTYNKMSDLYCLFYEKGFDL
ncbi:MAG: Eco57I restriction-modification methylase domain-containing protein, partial [Thermoflexibacteraceae bacterium]